MSFSETKSEIEYGDTVLLHVGYDNMLPIVISEGKTHQTKFGALKHDQLVGKRYGTRMQCPRGWIYLVHPTPELWTQSLPHRTQILYSTDISMVIFQLDLKPGCIVIEAGTGSGSLSHSILRTIQPSGHLYTFEFHKERSVKAQEEFQQHGLSSFVTVCHRDVCEEGFPHENIADAVFLDLPRPWDCIKSAKRSIKREDNGCYPKIILLASSSSPPAVNGTTSESLIPLMIDHTDALWAQEFASSSRIVRLKGLDSQESEGGRICTFSPCIEQVQRSCDKLSKEGFQEIMTMECLNRSYNIQYAKLTNMNFQIKEDDLSSKDEISSSSSDDGQSRQTSEKVPKLSNQRLSETLSLKSANTEKSSLCFASAVPVSSMPGHTGFLTFATLLCKSDSEDI